MEKQFYVHISASRRNGTLYVGVASDLVKRVWEHKNGLVEGFTKKYSVKMLVYYKAHESAENAVRREKQIKKWNRAWKEGKKDVTCAMKGEQPCKIQA